MSQEEEIAQSLERENDFYRQYTDNGVNPFTPSGPDEDDLDTP